MSHAAVLGSVFVVHLLAMLSPGPNVLVVTQAAASRTRRAGVLVALGVATGAALWSAAALLGLSLLFARVAWLYEVLTLVGGAYLLYLAHRLWRGASQPLRFSSGGRAMAQTDAQAFRLGLVTNLTNPKALVFYGSVFAALLGPGLPVGVKVAAFAIIVVNAALWHTLLACLFAARGTQDAYQRAKPWIDRLAAIALALPGLRLVLATLATLPTHADLFG